jgi:hypothetical protein
MIRTLRFISLPALVALAGCGGGGEQASNNVAGAVADAMPTEEELARDADLANEAAADEASDMSNFGGSAAEMELRNAD